MTLRRALRFLAVGLVGGLYLVFPLERTPRLERGPMQPRAIGRPALQGFIPSSSTL